jgi:SAM-dependent methyltransferase
MSAQEWFERWFGEEYKRLYPHRNNEQAALQVGALLQAAHAAWTLNASVDIRVVPGIRNILDVGCGAGRHLAALRKAGKAGKVASQGSALETGVRTVGIDLSPVMLRDARAAGLPVARADMRRLPFADGVFDLVACFFTSFGYFATPGEDAEALAEFTRVLRPGGLLFLDLPNRDTVVRGLVAAEVVESGGRRVDITRTFEGDMVVKRIRIRDTDAGQDGDGDVFEERVRLYSLAAIGPVLGHLGLEIVTVLGDERGAAFDPAASPRMSLLLRSPAEAA